MKQLQVDVAVIGAGTAGMTAYRSALAHTRSIVVIEGGPFGTTCARVGCMPSKLLIAAAEAAHTAEHAGAFGVHAGPVRIDGEAVMRRVRNERDRFVGFVTEAVGQWPAEHRLHGFARFVDDHTLQVGEHTRVIADRIVIATGSHPSVPANWREAAGDRLLVNDDVFAWQTLPRSVAVLGAGVIALELAQALHRLGVRVRLYGRSARIGPLTDPALQALTRELFAAELPVQLEAKNLALRREGDEVVVHTEAGEQRFDWVLAAAGRAPNLHQLGLEHTRLPLDAQGVPHFDRRTGQIGNSHVFIAGDANSEVELLHEAADEGRIAGDNAGRWPDVRERPRRAPLAVAFTDPQIMLAGSSHRALCHDGASFETGEVSFDDQGRSRVMLKNRGALRIYAEHGSGRLLGAEMIGPAAEHLGHLLSWSIQRGDTVQQMLDSPFYHPVIEEGLRTALRIVQRALRMGPPPVERCLDCGPGA
ncbi:dihydrolipoyl dehydrogenase [Ideonella sp.]|uniref:dihydrolipoyl dehydrogenase n=1 Tax=Ideonella sp. TaxID=1929293 RepID=UPI002B465996|nr:dihydrolipoyl dehydrogenase [Ideonella sp.]HJV70962.1 dihydrolipoyl dehydrogenase [Ideonella sp.]